MRLIIEPKDSLLHEDVTIVAEDLEPNANYLFVMKSVNFINLFLKHFSKMTSIIAWIYRQLFGVTIFEDHLSLFVFYIEVMFSYK